VGLEDNRKKRGTKNKVIDG